MNKHAPNGIRAHNDRHTLATIWATLSPWATAPRTTPRAHTYRNIITPPGFRIYDKINLTASIPMGCSAVGRDTPDENIQNINLL